MIGTLLGSLVGAGVALLYAPKSGEETRMVIKEKSIELKDKAMETGDELRHKAEEAAAKTKEFIDETTENTRTQVHDLQSRGMAFLDEQRDRIRHAIESGRKEEVKLEAVVENGKEQPEPAV